MTAAVTTPSSVMNASHAEFLFLGLGETDPPNDPPPPEAGIWT
jgi:hypothetical protein